jgi:O-antigen/teichoic acid export membrane protein
VLRRVLHAAGAVFLGYGITRLGSLILVPLFLKYWSASLYGEYLALFAAVAYLNSLDIGMQGATVNRLTQAYAREKLNEYRSVQHTALFFFVILATVVSLLVAVVFWFLPISRWIGLRETTATNAAIVMTLLAAYVMWAMPVSLMSATYQTTGNMARTQWIRNGQQIMVVILTASVLFAGGGMKAIASLQVLTIILVGFYVLFDVHRSHPELSPRLVGGKLSVLKELAHPSMLFALLMVGNLVAYEGSILLTSAALGGVAVAVLSVSKSIADVIRQGLYGLTLSLCPDFARLETLGELDKLRKIHRITVAATSAFTLAFAASVWYEGPEIITVWTRGRLQPDVVLLRLFLVLVAFQTPWAVSSTVARASNRHKAQAVGYFFAAVLGIALVAALIRRLGTWAVPIGLTIGEALTCYHFVIKATCDLVGESYSRFALRFWSGFVAVSTTVLMTGWVIHHMMPEFMLLRWLAVGLFTLSVAVGCGWAVWLTPEDRTLLMPKLRPLLLALSGVRA